MIRALLLSLLGGVSREKYDLVDRAFEGRVRENQKLFYAHLDAEKRADALRADLARVEAERDAAHVRAERWASEADRWANEEGKTAEANIRANADLLDAHQRIADLEAKLASAESPLALAERRYAQAWWAWRTKPLGLGDTGDMAEAREALRAAYAAAAKGEGGEGER